MNSPVPQKTSLVQRLDRLGDRSRPTRFVQAATVVAALSTLVPGVWMRIDPASFARLANFPVHDEHFLRDAGVFQIGIGLMMLGTLRYRDCRRWSSPGWCSPTPSPRSPTRSTATSAATTPTS